MTKSPQPKCTYYDTSMTTNLLLECQNLRSSRQLFNQPSDLQVTLNNEETAQKTLKHPTCLNVNDAI